MPSPVLYINPRLLWAMAWPLSAALRYEIAASLRRSLLERSAPRLFCASGPASSAAFCNSDGVERPGERNNLENHGLSSINHLRPFVREQQVKFHTFARHRWAPAGLSVFQGKLVAKDSAAPHLLNACFISPALATQLA